MWKIYKEYWRELETDASGFEMCFTVISSLIMILLLSGTWLALCFEPDAVLVSDAFKMLVVLPLPLYIIHVLFVLSWYNKKGR